MNKMTYEEQIAIINEATMHPDATIQYIGCDADVMGWQDADDRTRGFWNFQSLRYRMKPATIPTSRPWTQSEVIPNAVYRLKELPNLWTRIGWYSDKLIVFTFTDSRCRPVSYSDLQRFWEYSINLGRSWHECATLEENCNATV